MRAPFPVCRRLLTGDDQARDQAGGRGRQDIAVVDPAPFIAARRSRQVIAAPVMDAIAAIPVGAIDMTALVPAAMVAIVVAIKAVLVVTDHHGSGAMIIM